MNLTLNLGIACALSLSAGTVHALDDYRCKIETVHSANGEGPDSLVHSVRKYWIGTEFSVSRKTGAMTGPMRNNYWNDPQLIDRGSAENSFKAVTILRTNEGLGPGSAVYVLVIQEHHEKPEKPFTFFDGDEVFFGTCHHEVAASKKAR